MLKGKRLKGLCTLLAVASMFSMCTTGYDTDYSDWYNEDPQDDLLATMFGDDKVGQDESYYSGGRWDDWYNEDKTETATAEKKQAAAGVDSLGLESGNTSIALVGGHIPDFRSELSKETKNSEQNRVELTVTNQVKIKTLSDSRWRPFSGAGIDVEDNQNLRIVSVTDETDANGVFKIVLEPKEPFMFFSFVPLEKTGFEPYNYSVPVEALELKTISFNLQTAEGARHSYRYSYQLYDVRPAVESFVNMEINSKTKPVTVHIYGNESKHPVQGAKVTLKGTPPTRLGLLTKYFKNFDLLKYALTVAPDYAVTSDFAFTDLSGAQMRMYVPFDYTLEVSHPNYFFTTKDVHLTADTKTVEIFLDRLHTNAKIIQTGPGDELLIQPLNE